MSSPSPTNDNTELHTGTPPARRWLFVGTKSVAVFEWLMFELLRKPYAPPGDMSTFLGQEKYGLVRFMCSIAAMWLLSTIGILVFGKLTQRDYMSFVVLLIAIGAAYAVIFVFPLWPVTPWGRIWM